MVACSIAKAVGVGGDARQRLVHRRAARRAAARHLRAGHRPRAGRPLLPLRATDDTIRRGRATARSRPSSSTGREKLNALTRAMWRALGEAIDALSADDGVRCIILRGAGEKAFSPGNDIGEFATERVEQGAGDRVRRGDARDRATRSRACRHPLVAQIHGICVGGGLEIAALCDLRICGDVEPLRRADQEPRPRDGVRRRWRRSCASSAPRSRSRSCSRAASSTPPRRWQKGLVTRVVADAEVAAEARATAQRIAEGAPLVARWHKKFARRLADPRAAHRRRARRVLRLLRHRGLPHRLRGVPREAQAGVRGR